MKVAIHVDGPVIRGNERQAIRVAVGLRERGHEVVVSCRRGGPVEAELARRGVRTTGIRPRGDADLWSTLRFAGWLRRERFDAVLLTSWKRAFIGAAAARIARVPRVVYRLGGLQPLGSGLSGIEERYALRHWAHAIVTNARAIDRLLADAVPDLDPAKLHYVPNGIEGVSAPPAPLRDELGIAPDVVLVAAVGGLEPNKGFDLLVEAIARVPAGLHGVLVGGGTEEQRAALEQLVRESGVADRVHLLGRRDDVAAVLAACDLFVLSSRSEGMAVVTLEAMAAGLPVVAFDAGGTRDVIGEREGRPAAGWLVPPEDAAALGADLGRVAAAVRAGSPAVAERVREASWRIDHWFGVDRMVERYEAVLAGTDG